MLRGMGRTKILRCRAAFEPNWLQTISESSGLRRGRPMRESSSIDFATPMRTPLKAPT